MYKEYLPDHIYQNNITAVSCSDFYFIINYAELMNQTIPEFLHKHDLYEIYYVTDGTMECWCDGKIHELNKGDVIFLGKNLEHHMIYNPVNQGQYFVLIFDIEPKNTTGGKSVNSSFQVSMDYHEIRKILKRIDEEKYIVSSDKLHAEDLLSEMYQEQIGRKIGWNSLIGMLYYHFFMKAIRLLSQERSGSQMPSGYMNVALTATKYIHANYPDEINLDEIATLLNVTPRHINRLFQDMFGTPFARTINVIRMHYSKQYLCNTEKSIEWIANRVRLPSAKALTKIFKEQEGISPVEYRMMYRNKKE